MFSEPNKNAGDGVDKGEAQPAEGNVNQAPVTANDAAASNAAAVFAEYDSRSPQIASTVNPHPFAIMTSEAAEVSHLVPNSYLFIKEPGQAWTFYHINIIGGKRTKVKKDPREIVGLEAVLASEQFTPEVYRQIKDIVKAAQVKDDRLKVLQELVDTEDTFQRCMVEIDARIKIDSQGLDSTTKAELELFLSPHRHLANPFAGFTRAQCAGLTQDEQIALYEDRILHALKSDVFQNNLKMFFSILPHNDRLKAFFNEAIHTKDKVSLFTLDENRKAQLFIAKGVLKDEERLTLADLLITPVQRFPRYVLLLNEIIRKTPMTSASLPRFSELATEMVDIGVRLNLEAGKESNVNRLLLARQSAGKITSAMRVLQNKGIELDRNLFENVLNNMHNGADLGDVRSSLKTYLTQLYSQVYVEHRTLGLLTTSKDDVLKGLETFIFNVDNALTAAGMAPLFVPFEMPPKDEAEKHARAKVQAARKREDIIFGSVSATYDKLNILGMQLVSAIDTKENSDVINNMEATFLSGYAAFIDSDKLREDVTSALNLLKVEKGKQLPDKDVINRLKGDVINVIKLSVGTLQSHEMTTIIAGLYEKEKSNIESMVAVIDSNASVKDKDKEMSKIEDNFANIFKILQKMGPKAKTAWNIYVAAKGNVNIGERQYDAGLFIIPKENIESAFHEINARKAFNKQIKAFQKKGASITPLSEAAASLAEKSESDDDEAELDESRKVSQSIAGSGAYRQSAMSARHSVVEEKNDSDSEPESAPMQHYSSDILSQHALKREIFGILAANLITAKAMAEKLSFDQFAILEKFADQINNKVIEDQRVMAQISELENRIAQNEFSPERVEKEKLKLVELKARVIPDKMDAKKMAKVFADDFVRAYVDASMLQAEKSKDSILPILQEFVVNFDLSMQQLSKSFVQVDAGTSIEGIILTDKDKKPSTAKLDEMVLGHIIRADVKTARDVSALGREMVNHLFDSVVAIINRRPQGESEHLAFVNTLKTVMQMGEGGMKVWNSRAAMDFYELSIDQIPDDKLLKSFNHVSALANTEEKRRDDIVKLACNCFTEAMKTVSQEDFPEAAREKARETLINANHAGITSREQLRHALQLAIYDIHKKAYAEGRERSWGRSVADAYLSADVAFIKNLDVALEEKGQLPLMLSASAYRSKDIENANLIWNQAPAVFGKGLFPAYIKTLFDSVKQNFDEMDRSLGQVVLLSDYTNDLKNDNDNNPFVKAQKNLVNTLKAIQRMCVSDATAKTLWNACVAEHVETVRDDKYGAFRSLLKIDSIHGEIEESDVKSQFKSALDHELNNRKAAEKVSSLFGATVEPFKAAMRDLLDPDMATQYSNYKKKKTGNVYDARLLFVKTLLEVQKTGEHGIQFWNELVNANAGRYMRGFVAILQLKKPITEAMAKEHFESFLNVLKDIHDDKNDKRKETALSAFFQPGKVIRPPSPERKEHSQSRQSVSKQGALSTHSRSPGMFQRAEPIQQDVVQQQSASAASSNTVSGAVNEPKTPTSKK
jgi:ACT domain-containing protein